MKTLEIPRRTKPLLEELARSHANGGVLFAGFEAASRHAVQPGRAFLREFLASPELAAALPALSLDPAEVAVLHDDFLGFEARTGAFALAGDIASTVWFGGAYESFRGTAIEAMRLAEDFVSALIGHRLNEPWVFRSYAPWSRWFHDVAWDSSWIVLDAPQRRIWILCVTDTD